MAILATYVSDTSFTTSGIDITQELMYGRRLECNCDTDGFKYVTVSGSSYSDPLTTVTLLSIDSHDLTSNLTSYKYGPGVGEYGSSSARGLKHSKMDELGFVESGHTGFQPAGDYLTDSEFSTYSGTLQTQIDGKEDVFTEIDGGTY